MWPKWQPRGLNPNHLAQISTVRLKFQTWAQILAQSKGPNFSLRLKTQREGSNFSRMARLLAQKPKF